MNHILENNIMRVVVSEHGAELQSFYNKPLALEYVWQGNPEYWARRSPVLFPNVGRLKEDTYTFDGNAYHLTQHGFARDKAFKLTERTETTLTFKLVSDDETKKMYPFDFELVCTYVLTDSTLRVMYDVLNTGDKKMYYSIGAHPAFNTTLNDEQFEDFTVALYGLGEFKRYLLEGPFVIDRAVETVINPHIDLERDWFAMDAVIFETDRQQVSVDVYNKQNHGVRVTFNETAYVGIWSPYPKQAPFVCVEPWQGIADTTTHDGQWVNKKGMNQLEIGQHGLFTYDITGF
ncbi:aldose 1-epimerase family protein [Carnobacteriaceae bacterium zg-ZUI252]|nr:aldose 1-epimerase family protein [Carnobacteriaceae bacterium zg-ZUI252]